MAVKSINLEPNWNGVRAWVYNIARTDPVKAREIADTMGCEAPDLSDYPEHHKEKPVPTRTAERTQFLADVVIGFVEDFGYNQWRQIEEYKHPEAYPENTEAVVYDTEEEESHLVNIETVARGIINILSEDFSISAGLYSVINEANQKNDAGEIDAEGADTIVQAGLFGEIVYG